ncbi:acyltransferase family protein [Mucisphaera calidilacus]|uniref:Acyltransferase family protein n=1 Tax=Mucisphaera calidilacus TaxID=2527982 RepID=A0A518C0M9_9BACT|nr:acyltransferase [Mucisphaera calidilacus]QDU72782.1 Acyltransferase family protein [Mucisphaera calidilacus]
MNTPVSQRTHIDGFDLIRVLAVIGIVTFHFGPDALSTLGYSGLPAFIIMSFSLQSSSPRANNFAAITARRAQRLLVPWAAWSLIYAAVYYWLHRHQPITLDIVWSDLFVGYSIHLWYLVFAFIATLILALIQTQTQGWRRRSTTLLLLALGGTAATLLALKNALGLHHLPAPWPQWLFGLPGLFFGAALGMTYHANDRQTRRYRATIVFFAIASTLFVLYAGNAHDALAYVIAIAAVYAALEIKLPPSPTLRYLASLTFGTYLAHYFVYLAILSCSRGQLTNQWAILALTIFLTSIAISAAQRIPYLRRIV